MSQPDLVTQDNFLDELRSNVPEAICVVDDDHIDDRELLAHLLLPDLLRFAVAAFHEGREDEAGRLLQFVDYALSHGDNYISEAIAVSFVENAGTFPDETPEFLASWPAGLRRELARQNHPARDDDVDPKPPAD
ncbi:MAG: hypothetical protein H7288_25830 [Kineosporiaceae bacterium]|nr:hypothetical protein [Aeromicrobium sp.]